MLSLDFSGEKMLSIIFERILFKIDLSPLSPYFPLDQNIPKTSFDDKNFPGQMFEIYMREISSKFACPKQCYILSFIYIDREI